MLSVLLIIASVLGLGSVNNSNSNVNVYSSKAFNLKDGRLIYRAYHEEKFQNEKISESITRYKDPQDKLLSERIMIFGDDLTKPKFILKDFRSGYIEGSEILPNNKVKVYTRDNFNDKMSEKILQVEEPFVIDGGLTYFFRANWEKLLNDDTIEFNFITPAKLDYYRFRVSKNSIVTVGGRKGMQLKLEINSFILRAFVDPILITYALDNKEILSYKGISNVNDENGKSHLVEIDFTDKGDK
jgi:hypothetical protein